MINQTVNNRLHYLGGGMQVMSHTPATVASDWWNPGGSFTCVAAYAAKGAASLAASYVNLANPGTYDAAPGVAPTWASGTGWTFDGSTQYLKTGVTPTNNQTWSMFVRFSNCTSSYGWIVGGAAGTEGPWFGIEGNRPDHAVLYASGDLYFPSPALTSGVLGVAGNKGYRNGTVEAGTIASKAGTFNSLYIGAAHYNAVDNYPYPGSFLNVEVQAIAIYSTTLDATQVSTLTTNMNSL